MRLRLPNFRIHLQQQIKIVERKGEKKISGATQKKGSRSNCSERMKTGLLIGCGKKKEILRHFQGKLCGKKGPLCGKLCDFFKAGLTLFY